MALQIIFFGTPEFSAKTLGYLLDHGVDVAAVVTQPDRPKGRNLQLTPSPVKALAQQKAPHIPILQPEKASDPQFLETLASYGADLYVVVAFGQILSQKLLDLAPKGCINVHTSLLPKYRGAAPIQRAIMAGESETGVAIQKMVRQLDAGDVIAVAKTKISEEMNFAELEQRLNDLANPLLLQIISQYRQGIPPAEPQDHSQMSYAAKIEMEEGEVRWDRPAKELHNLIRAFSPKPGAWCWVYSDGSKKRLKILRAAVSKNDGIACGEEFLQLIEVQPEGKKAMPAADWLRGQKNISFTP